MTIKEDTGSEPNIKGSSQKMTGISTERQIANTVSINDVKPKNSGVHPLQSIPFILDDTVICERWWDGEKFVGFAWGEERFNELMETGD